MVSMVIPFFFSDFELTFLLLREEAMQKIYMWKVNH